MWVRKRPDIGWGDLAYGCLQRRILRFDERHLAARQARARRLAEKLAEFGVASVRHPPTNTFWVFPYQTDDKGGLAEWLLKHGFDIVCKSSLVALHPTDIERDPPQSALRALEATVFLPAYPKMPQREIDRLARLLCEFEAGRSRKQAQASDVLATCSHLTRRSC